VCTFIISLIHITTSITIILILIITIGSGSFRGFLFIIAIVIIVIFTITTSIIIAVRRLYFLYLNGERPKQVSDCYIVEWMIKK
jgi:hypothetical protein